MLCRALPQAPESTHPIPPWGGIIKSDESSQFHAAVVMGSDTEGVGVDKGLAQINTMLAGWVKEKNHRHLMVLLP